MVGAGGNAPLVHFPNYFLTAVLQTADGNNTSCELVPGTGIEPVYPGL